jgi:hypothetical protein
MMYINTDAVVIFLNEMNMMYLINLLTIVVKVNTNVVHVTKHAKQELI